MPIPRWIPVLACSLVLAQDAPFFEEKPDPWIPRWELTAGAERIEGMVPEEGYPAESLRRSGLQARLRWDLDWGGLEWQAGVRSAAGSDGNRFNLERWDQQPSNGTRLDMARVDLARVSESYFGRIRLGFQDLGLITSQAMWDGDLRLLGAAASGGFRAGPVEEAGFRAAAGKVKTLFTGDDVDLAAFQGVLKVESGAFSGSVHADRWDLKWDPRRGRLEPMNRLVMGRQRLVLDGIGFSGAWDGAFPVEVRWSGYREPDTRDTSEEFQMVAGSRVRPFVPQASFTWQRLSATGELYPLGSDQWWYFRSAKGPRYDLNLPLRGLWTLSVTYLRQRTDWTPVVAEKTILKIVKRF